MKFSIIDKGNERIGTHYWANGAIAGFVIMALGVYYLFKNQFPYSAIISVVFVAVCFPIGFICGIFLTLYDGIQVLRRNERGKNNWAHLNAGKLESVWWLFFLGLVLVTICLIGWLLV